MRGWKKIFHAIENDKKMGVAVLRSNKVDIKTKAIKKEKEHYIIAKGSIQEKTITLVKYMHPI